MPTQIINYNGQGRWTVEEVVRRYSDYVHRFHVTCPRLLEPRVLGLQDRRWIYPIMEEVIAGIEAGDLACAEIGVEFIQESASFPFGRILKANTARALRRGVTLTPYHADRIRRRVIQMLTTQYLPREFREYAKLARKVGIAQELKAALPALNLTNRWVAHFYRTLTCT